MPPLITLTTDFGTSSPYVAAMKGVALGICANASFVDVAHDVPPFDVGQGGFVLWAGTRHFPPGAVHVGVVDPGVGTSRRAVALRLGESWYVGPDNGLFGLVLERAAEDAGATPDEVIELRRPVGASATFEGRDVFAPAAAALACGRPPAELGTPLTEPLVRLPDPGPVVRWVDRFGNLVTTLRGPVTTLRGPVAGLRVNGRDVRAGARTFGEAAPGQPFWFMGSMGYLEIGVALGRADVALGARPGTPLELLV